MKIVEKMQVKSGSALGYVDAGQGIPVILIHGLFFDHTAFEQQIQAFKDRARIIAVDVHGHGKSSPLNQPISLDEMAEDYFDLVQQLGIQKAIWGGVSLGGMASLRIAIRHPESVLGLLLLNTSAARGVGKKVPSLKGLNAPLTLRFLWKTRFFKRQALKALFGRTTLASNPDLQRSWADRMEQMSSLSMQHSIEAILGASEILEQLSSIPVPTLIATGDEDTAVPKSASQTIQNKISHSTLVEIKRCGHSSSIEQPEQVNQLLGQLLSEVSRSTA